MADPFNDTTSMIDGLSTQMGRLETVTAQFGRTLSRSLVQGIAQGKGFEDVLRGLGEKLVSLSLNAAFKPLENLLNGVFGQLSGTAANLVSGAFSGGGGGGLFGSFGAGLGSGTGGGLAAPPVTVNMAVSSPDAASFLRAESQVSAALARAVSRGQRSL